MEAKARKPSARSRRQEEIISLLTLHPAMRVGALAGRLDVSAETIRRDLARLDEDGLISRTYGGAVRPIAFEPALAERQGLMVEERARIAAAAASRVARNDILMIGGGATTVHLAQRLSSMDLPLTVITHAFSVAMALAGNPLVKVLMLPGQYDGREGLIHGADTIEALNRFRANKAFLGATGLTAEGPNDAAVGPGLIYGGMMRRAAETFVLADHGKFGRPSLTVYGPWGPLTTLVADRAPEGELADAMAAAGAAVMVA